MSVGRLKWSLAGKIGVMTVSIIVLMAGIVVSFNIRKETKNSRKDLIDHGLSVATIMAQNCEAGIFAEDKDALSQIADSVILDPEVAYVAVLNSHMKPLVQKAKKPVFRFPEPVHQGLVDHELVIHREIADLGREGSFLDFLAGVRSNPRARSKEIFLIDTRRAGKIELIGYLQIGLSLERLHQRRNQFLKSSFAFTIFFLVVGIGMALSVANRIVSPVKQLQKATRDISEGELSGRIEVNSNDEIKDLSRAFNVILSRFQEYRYDAEKKAEEVFTAKSRLEHLLFSSSGVIFSCDPASGYAATFVSANLTGLLGYGLEEFLEDPKFWLKVIHPEDREGVTSKLHHLMDVHSVVHEFRMRHKDGKYRWLRDDLRLAHDREGRVTEAIGHWMDISDHKALEEQLYKDAFHDALTGLPNRALFLDRLSISFARLGRQKDFLFALLFIDLDRFKNINDSLGHLAGDQLLMSVSSRLQKSTRLGDTVARLGGDEFAMILEGIKTVEDAQMIAQRIHAEINHSYVLNESQVFTTASIGIALAHADYTGPDQILRDADTAMYRAKALGRSCTAVFNKEMRHQAVNRLQLEMDLRHAVERREFILHYQPILSLRTQKSIGFEALVRWKHPTRGIIYPNDFIPVAEETGLIIPIGQWILREACRQVRFWQNKSVDAPRYAISVNISSLQLAPEFPRMVLETLRETHLDPSSLILELTESTIIENAELAAGLVESLRKMNVRITIDDFGVGYSSMKYLHKLPVNGLKIDRSFVQAIHPSGETIEIVKTILNLAQNLRLEVIAEGVETSGQLNVLKELKVGFAQGYLFSKPKSPQRIEELLSLENGF